MFGNSFKVRGALQATAGVTVGDSDDGAATAGVLGGAGKSSAYYLMAGASQSLLSYYIESASTADSNRVLFARLKLSGVAGGGEAGRFFTTAASTAHVAARGIHTSLSLGTGATIAGESQALKATYQVPNRAAALATSGVIQAEAYSDGSSTSIGSGTLAFFQATLSGDATGAAALNSTMSLFSITTPATSSGKLVVSGGNEPTWAGATYKIRCTINGTAFYLIGTAA